MTLAEFPSYFRMPWPDAEVPADSPVWLHYEIDEAGDAVLRTIEVYADGHIARNSIEIEERDGRPCPSLIDTTLREGFDGLELQELSRDSFEELWCKGTDTPVWNDR